MDGASGDDRRGEQVVLLDDDALALFARKGTEGGPGVPQAGPANAVKVRRVLQVVRDLSPGPFAALRVLDAGCGEGVYAIEAALRGANVLAVDARDERREQGAACAERHGLSALTFAREDVRALRRETHGTFDAILFLGILYHLDAPDVFGVVENLFAMCRRLLVVDTFVSEQGPSEFPHGARSYRGERVREHDDGDPEPVRRARLLRSIDNTHSVRFTRDALVRLLVDTGFTSVFECLAPLEPGKPQDRRTIVACKGTPVLLSTYRWLDGRSEADIERTLREEER